MSGIQALDGLFVAARREVFDRVRFDEQTFDGFHRCDVDLSYRAHLAGFNLGVAYDLPVLQVSAGSFDECWERYAERIKDRC